MVNQRRCAIYTRKSSDEGLEQAFNSLHAQREACEAYALSQASEGWVVVPTEYDDAAYSGGSLERPALKRLLTDVAAGQIDTVLVYKVDRLTRSLPDFARIIEAFDRAGVGFVSITQPFNTTSSMGRLTLNVLLSFAQFEREVTAERIRDKIGASKAKGMWMGGVLPLGYDRPRNEERALEVNPTEAKRVRLIFQRYLELRSLATLRRWLDANGVRSKERVGSDGKRIEGFSFTTGALRHLLSNPVYVGKLSHKGVIYQGRHRPIVDEKLFAATQALMQVNSDRRARALTSDSKAARMLLGGLLVSWNGVPMRRRVTKGTYHYYVAPRSLVCVDTDVRNDAIHRVSAPVIEAIVVDFCRRVFPEHRRVEKAQVHALAQRIEVHPQDIQIVLQASWSGDRLALLRERLLPSETLCRDGNGVCRVLIRGRVVGRGGRSWAWNASPSRVVDVRPPYPRLAQRLKRGHAVLAECGIRHLIEANSPACRDPQTPGERHLATLAFLSPALQLAILDGAYRRDLKDEFPLLWSEQIRLMSSPS